MDMNVVKAVVRLLKGFKDAERIGTGGAGRRQNERGGVYPFEAARQRAVSDQGGIRLLAEEVAAERSRIADRDEKDPVSVESSCLVSAAKRIGCYVDVRQIKGSRISKRTGESEVFWDADAKAYWKIKNPFAKLHLKKHGPAEVLYEHIVHNLLFPETRLEFTGVTDQAGEARLVFKQAAVCADHLPDDRQISEDLMKRGLVKQGKYEYGNDWVLVTDVMASSDNVLLGDDGELYFIDPIIGFKPPLIEKLNVLSTDETAIDALISAFSS